MLLSSEVQSWIHTEKEGIVFQMASFFSHQIFGEVSAETEDEVAPCLAFKHFSSHFKKRLESVDVKAPPTGFEKCRRTLKIVFVWRIWNPTTLSFLQISSPLEKKVSELKITHTSSLSCCFCNHILENMNKRDKIVRRCNYLCFPKPSSKNVLLRSG